MASFELRLPDIGEGIVEGEIVTWLVSEGDVVVEDQPIVEVMTDKATVVIPSPRAGRVVKLHVKVNEAAKVRAPLVTLEVAEGAGSAEEPQPIPSRPVEPAAKVLATPVTRRIAREHGVDLSNVGGTGPNGRILKSDVLRTVGQNGVANLPAPAAAAEDDERIPLRGLRRAIAKKMVESKLTAPHYTFVEEVDATELKALRRRLNERLAQGDVEELSYLPFIAKALVAAFRAHPRLNATFDEAAQELVVRKQVNLGIAVATEEGLLVPVVKDAQAKSLREISVEIASLANRARKRALKSDELTGGTFTITSLGESGGLFATPIIHHPEVAILGVHRMRPRPVVREGRIEVRDMMHLSLSLDHRVIDGAVGAAFAYDVIRTLETPELLLLDLR